MITPRVKRFFLLLGITYIALFFIFRWGNDPVTGWKGIIESDGKGYYSYLLHAFVKNDLKYTPEEHLYAVQAENGKYVNKFYCGTALLQLPFFLIGHLSAWMFGYPADGFSQPYAMAIGFSSLFYSWLGMFFLFCFLRRNIGCNESTSLWVTALAVFGTNLIFYSVIFGSFSHAYSFLAVTGSLYLLHRLQENFSNRTLALLAFTAGVVIVIRPVNAVLFLLAPAVFKSKTDFFQFSKKLIAFRSLSVTVPFFFFPLFIQCWLWYLQTGNWIEWSYQQEGFYFSNPEITGVLFEFRRGLFIYCPLLLISLFGLVYGFRHHIWKTSWLLATLMVFTYITASWWHWTYGDTFGIRPFNDALILFLILLAFLVTGLQQWKKTILLICVLASVLNLIFAYQFARGILNVSTMNRDKFFSLFMKMGAGNKGIYGGENDIAPYAPNGFETIHFFKDTYDTIPHTYNTINGNEWPGGTEFMYPAEKNHVRHCWIEISYRRKMETETAMKDVLFVIHSIIPSSDSTAVYYAFRVKEYPQEKTNEWKQVTHRIWIPNSFSGKQLIKMYFWNRGLEKFELDDYQIKVQLPKW